MSVIRVDVHVEETRHGDPHWRLRSARVTHVTCTRCGHTTEAFGDSDASARRACIELRDTCPKGQRNFYSIDGG